MRILKIKLVTALVLGAISFGMFSFTTKPINAQSTNSEVLINEATSELGFWQLNSNAEHILTAAVNYLIYGGQNETSQYPNDIID